MNKPWLQHYGNDIPQSIDPYRYNNVVDIILEACERFGDKPAFSNFGVQKSYAEIEKLSRDFAAFLQKKVAVKKGDRVAVIAPNMMAFPVAMFGILRTGATQVNVNPMYTARELEHQLNDSGVRTIVIYAGSTGALADCIGNTCVNTVIVAGLDDLIGSGLDSPEIDRQLQNIIPFMQAIEQGAALEFEPGHHHPR